MADLGTVIRIWLSNNEWTQAKLANVLGVTESTVQKWVVGKNHPNPEMLKKLSEVMLIDIQDLYETGYLSVQYERLDDYVPPCMYGENFIELMRQLDEPIPEKLINEPLPRQDTCHAVYDAGLYLGAKLHRFKNPAGDDCSAIYLGREERWWHYRDHEIQMVRAWNDQEYRAR